MKINDEVLAQQISRLNNLKNEVVMQYSDEIDYDGDRDFIITDAIFSHLVKGDLNDFYESPLLEGMDEEERNRTLTAVNKYSYVLFYDQNQDSWYDSIDMALVDYDTIALKLLNYYDFLIRIYKNGGEKVLKELAKYVDYDSFMDTSVVDYLIGSFISDEVLEKVIIDMSLEDGPYKDFDTDKRACLLMYPEGTLYRRDENDNISFINPIELINMINQRDGDFEEIVSGIADDYFLDFYEKKKK